MLTETRGDPFADSTICPKSGRESLKEDPPCGSRPGSSSKLQQVQEVDGVLVAERGIHVAQRGRGGHMQRYGSFNPRSFAVFKLHRHMDGFGSIVHSKETAI